MKNMYLSKTTGLASMAILLIGFIGCSVEKEEEGDMPEVDLQGDSGNLPEYEIVKNEEGEMPSMDMEVEGGNIPEYDVEMADVDVGTTTKTMKVPKVKIVVEEEEFEVPYIDVTMPDDNSDQKKSRQSILAAVNTPNPGYRLKIQQIFRNDDDLIVISKLTKSSVQEADGEGVAKDAIVINAPEIDEIRHYVVTSEKGIEGRKGDYEIVRSIDEIDESFNNSQSIYKAN